MSKGPGKLQREILAYLQQIGRPTSAKSIAYTIRDNRSDHETWEPLPRSLEVSVRRAIHSLEKAKLVVTSHHVSGQYQDSHMCLMCWLPGQAAPKTTVILPGDQVEAAILDILRHKADYVKDAYDERAMYRVRGQHARINDDPDMISYSWLANQVRNKLGAFKWEGRIYPAISRAIKKLSKAGAIKAYWYRAGRYGWVGLA